MKTKDQVLINHRKQWLQNQPLIYIILVKLLIIQVSSEYRNQNKNYQPMIHCTVNPYNPLIYIAVVITTNLITTTTTSLYYLIIQGLKQVVDHF